MSSRDAGRPSGKAATPRMVRRILPLLAVMACAYAFDVSAAEKNGGAFISDVQDVRKITVTLNKSRTFRVERPFTTVVVGSPDIADVRSLSDRVIYVLGKKVGTTNISVFDDKAQMIGILDVDVSVDVGNLQQKISGSTGAGGIRVSSAQGQVVLSGTAVDAVAAERALSVAKGLAEGGTVVNAMQVAPPQQVLLEVRFLEVARTAGRELGVNWQANFNGKQIINTGLGSAAVNAAGGGPGSGVPILATAGTFVGTSLTAPFGNVLANIVNKNGTTLDALVTALEEKGVVRRLAEPNLIALSGEAARFLAGGEFPVPVASTPNGTTGTTVTIQFKTFGVELAFLPTVLSRGVISLRIEPSVSELDFTNAVQISGTIIPALTKRDARTTVELRDGQSFAIAGLLQTRSAQNIAQIPWLGSVPVLGTLFRSTAYQQNETDLVIIVTPRLVAPLVPGQRIATPLDQRLPANDVDLFVNGQMEVRKRYHDSATPAGAINGPYGHMIAREPPEPIVSTKN